MGSPFYGESQVPDKHLMRFIIEQDGNKWLDEFFSPDQSSPTVRKAMNLMFIHESRVHRIRYGALEKKQTTTQARVERMKSEVLGLRNDVYQIVGFYSVFQGLMFTAVTGSTSVQCRSWWLPFSLSVGVSLIILLGVWNKLIDIRVLERRIGEDDAALEALNLEVEELEKKGPEFRFAEVDKKAAKQKFPREMTRPFHVFEYVSFLLLLGLMGLFAASFPIILC